MNVQERIAKLEALLERIRSNAARPRQAVASLFGMGAAEPAPAAAPAKQVGQPAPAAPAKAVGQPAPAAPAKAVGQPAPAAAAKRVEPPAPAAAAKRVEPPAPAAAAKRVEPPAPPAPSPEPPSLEIVTDVEELEGLEAEMVEIAATESADLGELQIEEAPESAPRPAAHVEPEEIPPPIKTPPPESGRQAVTPPPAVAAGYPDDLEGAADVDALLEADLSGGAITARRASTPTVEQVGQTVDLESAEVVTDLELATLPPEPIPPSDELELALPKGGRAGAYEPSLEPPPEARDDLERHRRAREELRAPPPARVAAAPAAVPVTEPQVTERAQAPAAAAAEFVAAPPAEGPKTFLELLDASLRLG